MIQISKQCEFIFSTSIHTYSNKSYLHQTELNIKYLFLCVIEFHLYKIEPVAKPEVQIETEIRHTC